MKSCGAQKAKGTFEANTVMCTLKCVERRQGFL
jgi:hypothetical protein